MSLMELAAPNTSANFIVSIRYALLLFELCSRTAGLLLSIHIHHCWVGILNSKMRQHLPFKT